MALRIFNTRTRRKAAFSPGGPVRMYVCGPTVYGPSHMGHARAYVAFDVVRRYLESLGHSVRCVVNLTDVEDTITNRARETGVRPTELAARYAREYMEDMASLGVKPADANPRVSEHIQDIVAVGRDLVAAGKAYADRGSVYLDTGDGGGFGFLSHVDVRAALADEGAAGPRRHPLDFVIWRKAKPRGLAWGSPWGPGTPGWHIECYAMARKHLGGVDIHGGGRDLIYPHHESENLIARAHSGEDFATVWMHNGWLTLETEKMSKSLGNVVPLRDVLAAYPGDVVRLCLAKVHYREDVEYDKDCFRITAEELATIRGAIARLAGLPAAKKSKPPVAKLVTAVRSKFREAMDDDFDTNAAFYALLQFAEALAAVQVLSVRDRESVLAVARDLGTVFGVPL